MYQRIIPNRKNRYPKKYRWFPTPVSNKNNKIVRSIYQSVSYTLPINFFPRPLYAVNYVTAQQP